MIEKKLIASQTNYDKGLNQGSMKMKVEELSGKGMTDGQDPGRNRRWDHRHKQKTGLHLLL